MEIPDYSKSPTVGEMMGIVKDRKWDRPGMAKPKGLVYSGEKSKKIRERIKKLKSENYDELNSLLVAVQTIEMQFLDKLELYEFLAKSKKEHSK